MEAQNREWSILNAMTRVSWGAIFAGAFVAMFFQLLLGLLGLAIGLSIVDPMRQVSPTAVSIASGIWLLIVTLVSVFIGAFTAGRLAGLSAKYDGMLHGIATLAFLVILSLFLVTSGISSLITGAFSFGIQATQVPQVQQVIPGGGQIQQQVSQMQQQQQMTPQERQQAAERATSAAKQAAWWSFITGLLALIAAALGGFLGMQSRVKQIIRHEEA